MTHVDRGFFRRAHLRRDYRDALDLAARERGSRLPADRYEFARLVFDSLLCDRCRAAIALAGAASDEPSIHNIRAACAKAGAPLQYVAPFFGFLPALGRPGRWTDTADPDAEPAVVLAGLPAHAAAFAAWRALGGRPRVTIHYDDGRTCPEPEEALH